MKKNLVVGSINNIKGLNDSSMVLAVRSGKKIWIQNLELSPAVSITRTAEDEITLKVKLADGHHFVIQDTPGMAEKREIN